MLVLSRQRDETIMIGDEIEVTVVDIRGDKVRLGINAPRHVTVHRKEVWEAIKRENRAAAEVQPDDVPNVPRPQRPRGQRNDLRGNRPRKPRPESGPDARPRADKPADPPSPAPEVGTPKPDDEKRD